MTKMRLKNQQYKKGETGMANKGQTKLKLLYIKDYLEHYSDEEHPISARAIQTMLENKGIECERKSIYSDIQTLEDYGMEILRVRTPENGYYLGTREFEEPQLRLLIDAVQAANFITEKKTKELIKKIASLCSEGTGKHLTRQVYIENRAKCTNEEIYYSIDILNRAIQQGKKVSFIYCKRVVTDKVRAVKIQEKKHIVSPYALIWSSDHYYLVGNNQKYDNLMHVRIDRMKKVEMLDEKSRPFSEVSEYKRYFDSADYAEKLFNMFSGELKPLDFICDNSILEEILDRVGKSALITKCDDDEHFRIRMKMVVSEGLISWIMQFGNKLEVIEPVELRAKVKERAKEIFDVYEKESFFKD